MSVIAEQIVNENENGRRALSIFLTAGFPQSKGFTDLALAILESGADMLEIGIPFSDPLADGPIIQMSSQTALANGINLRSIFNFIEEIKNKTNKPIILMGYANPLLKYGLNRFIEDAENSGAEGLIVPDVPVEEADDFYKDINSKIDKILLTTPTSNETRIKNIDSKSEGFVYCVSVTGTTGSGKKFTDETITNLKYTYEIIKKNKMMIGFGISTSEDVELVKPYCDGIIIGSALIKLIEANKDNYMEPVRNYIEKIKKACEIN